MFRLFVCIAFALALIGLGSQQLLTRPRDAVKPISAQAAPISSVPVKPTSVLLWQLNGASKRKNYAPAVDGQCTDYSFPTDTSVYLPFKRTTTSCYRDQINPLANDTIFYLPPATYTWKFQTIVITDSYGIIWQIHPQDWLKTCNDLSPPVNLAVNSRAGTIWININYPPSFSKYWKLRFTNGETDDWKVEANLNLPWHVQVWHNGTKFVDQSGINYPPGCLPAFWNFGPYVWEWMKPNNPGTYFGLKVNRMDLYKQ